MKNHICSTHEEADTRIFIHLEDSVQQGYSSLHTHSRYRVVVLAIASASRLNISELWIAFVAGKSFRFIAEHKIARALGPDQYVALPMFHEYTGCDTVSFFGGRVRKTEWDTWTTYEDFTPAFSALGSMLDPLIIDKRMQLLHWCVL